MLWVDHSSRRVLPVLRVYILKKIEVTFDEFGYWDVVNKNITS
jgi:hypothetical protein